MPRLKQLAALLAISALAGPLAAHEEGSPFSGALIDPLVLHHAHVENEQRLNFSFLRGVQGFERRRSAIEAELEVAWANSRSDFGMEAFIPFSRLPSLDGMGTEAGVGDLELRPLKLALVNRPDLVLTTASALTLPTGDERRGLGSGNTVFAQHLFFDKAVGNWHAALNVAVDRRVRGERGSGVEYGALLAYSFIDGTPAFGLAAPRPAQASVLSVALEFIAEKRLSGEDRGEKSARLVPGVALWRPKSGWQVRAGISIPRSTEREADRTFLFQISNHLDWEALL